MRNFEKNRTRLLIICADQMVNNKLVTLLTSYGYYVDYVTTREMGIKKFKQYKQGIIIFDASLLPTYPKHLFRLFNYYKSNPKIVIASRPDQQRKIYPYLNNGVYDILQIPLNFENLDFILRRLVAYDTLTARYEYLKIITKLTVISFPLWFYFLIVITYKIVSQR